MNARQATINSSLRRVWHVSHITTGESEDFKFSFFFGGTFWIRLEFHSVSYFLTQGNLSNQDPRNTTNSHHGMILVQEINWGEIQKGGRCLWMGKRWQTVEWMGLFYTFIWSMCSELVEKNSRDGRLCDG